MSSSRPSAETVDVGTIELKLKVMTLLALGPASLSRTVGMPPRRTGWMVIASTLHPGGTD
jgi:hypothetical protein